MEIIKHESFEIDKLFSHPLNPKIHTPAQIQVLANSIKEFGFIQPIVSDEDGMILAGHGRVEALKLLGMKTGPVWQVKGLKEEQKTLLLVADNNSQMMTGFDNDILMKSLKELSELDLDLDSLGLKYDSIDYEPNLSPTTGATQTTNEDVNKARENLQNQFASGGGKLEICCPNCAHIFHIDK